MHLLGAIISVIILFLDNMHIVFVSPEVVPFAKTGGLADVSGVLPGILNKLGTRCTIIMPFYQLVRKNGFSPKLVKQNINIYIGHKKYKFNLYLLNYKGTDVYFIDNKELYNRAELYGTAKGDYPDNAMRFAFFSKAVLSVVEELGDVSIIHCNDWQTALVPFYLKLFKKDIKTLFTIHNMAYQGVFDKSVMDAIDIPKEFFTPDKLEFYGRVSFMKAGIIYSDAISTVSKGYAREILAEEFGCGLHGLLQTRKDSLYGITNGANYDEWNPKTDKYIVKNYDADSIELKTECKKDLLKSFGLRFDNKKPVIGMVTRLAEQKGIDIVAERIKHILSLDVYFVLLGTGDEKYNNLFRKIAQKYKNTVGVKIAFDNALAHKIEAGSDIFLIPSRYEPCGLNQMYSLKYGTVPIVRATGGLDDTIEDFIPVAKKGNGFKFAEPSGDAMYSAIKKAVELYKDRKMWRILQDNGLRCDFSWERSGREYIDLYKKIV